MNSRHQVERVIKRRRADRSTVDNDFGIRRSAVQLDVRDAFFENRDFSLREAARVCGRLACARQKDFERFDRLDISPQIGEHPGNVEL